MTVLFVNRENLHVTTEAQILEAVRFLIALVDCVLHTGAGIRETHV